MASLLGIYAGVYDKHRCGKLRIYHHELLEDIVDVVMEIGELFVLDIYQGVAVLDRSREISHEQAVGNAFLYVQVEVELVADVIDEYVVDAVGLEF